MNLDQLVKLHKELSKKIEALEEQKKALGIEIMQQMEGPVLQVEGFVVRRMNRLSIKLTLDEARFFDAIKTEEVIDKDRIKALYKAGHPIKGVSELEYIQVTEKKDANG